jgi:putative transposase
MPQSLAQAYLHFVFSTKNRTPWLSDPTIRDELHHYLGGTSKNLGCPVIRVGSVEDHIHLLCRFGRSITISDYVRELKRESSKWLKSKSRTLAEFHWQNGYGSFSISPSHLKALTAYIDNQGEHHRTESFQEEFRRLLRKYGLEWDERYVWD